MTHPDDILRFWIDEVGPAGWYRQDDAVDASCRDLFLADWEAAQEGGHADWLAWPRGMLAYVILLDQFPRNMFRNDDGRAFATDPMARAAAKKAILLGWDEKIGEPERQFFYLALMHSENISDQDQCVRLFLLQMPETGSGNLLHARAHREVIRRFGRFPHRNAALGRQTTQAEAAFLKAGGYGAIVRQMDQAAAADT